MVTEQYGVYHWSLMTLITHICVNWLGHHWFRLWQFWWQSISCATADQLLIRPSGYTKIEIGVEPQAHCFNEMDLKMSPAKSLQWLYDGCDGVWNNQPHDCLLDRLSRHRSKKTSKLCVTGPCAGNSPVTSEFSAKGPVTRKMFPFDDVIIIWTILFKPRCVDILFSCFIHRVVLTTVVSHRKVT